MVGNAEETGIQYYVDATNGADSNDGKSPEQAFKTIQKAQETIREMEHQESDIYVNISGGIYRLNESLKFSSEDSGKDDYKVIYQNASEEEVIIAGSIQVTDWIIHDAEKNIYKTNVPENIYSRNLFIDGEKATRAQERISDAFVLHDAGFQLPATGKFSEMAEWENPTDIEISQTVVWTEQRGSVSSIEDGVIHMKPVFWRSTRRLAGWGIGMNYPEVIENAYELLDEPGEWYLNRKEHTLYYMPKEGEDITALDVELPQLEQLLEVRGTIDNPVKNIEFKGITFSYNTNLAPLTDEGWPDHQAGVSENLNEDGTTYDLKSMAALEFDWSNNLVLENCKLENLGSAGVAFDLGSQNNIIRNNTIKNIGGNGIMIGDVNWGESGLNEIGQSDHHPEDERCVVKNNLVSRNNIQNIGQDIKSSVGIMCGFTDGTVIDHNTLQNLPYTAISVGWGWGSAEQGGVRTDLVGNNQICYNRIDNIMAVNDDGGAIYTLGRQDNSVIEYNYLSNMHKNYSYIYLDNGTQGYTVQYNVVSKELGGAQNHWYFSNDMGDKGATIQTYDNVSRYNYFSQGMQVFKNPPYCTEGANQPVNNGQWPEFAKNIMENTGTEGGTVETTIPDFSENYAYMRDVAASGTYEDYFLYAPEKALDGDTTTKWMGKENETNWWLEIDLGSSRTFNKLILDDNKTIKAYKVYALENGKWINIGRGQEDHRVVWFDEITTDKIRIQIDALVSSASQPQIAEIEIYNSTQKIGYDEVTLKDNFKNGKGAWISIGTSQIGVSSQDFFTGYRSLQVGNRTAEYEGTQMEITDFVRKNGAGIYEVDCLLKSELPGISKVGISIFKGNTPTYFDKETNINANIWTGNMGEFNFSETDLEGMTAAFLTVNTKNITTGSLGLDNYAIKYYKGYVEPENLDTSELLNLITQVQDLEESIYTETSWSKLQTCVKIAKDLLETQNITQKEVNTVSMNLENAITLLEKKPVETGRLEELLSRIGKLNQSEYTEASWKALEQMKHQAESLLGKEGVSQAELDKAVEDLDKAKLSLKKNINSPNMSEGEDNTNIQTDDRNKEQNVNIQTGDQNNYMLPLILIFISFGTILVLLIVHKLQNKDIH